MGRLNISLREVGKYFKTAPGSATRRWLRVGYFCSLLFWIYQALPRWDWVEALRDPSGMLFLIFLITVIGHCIYAFDRWSDQRIRVAEEKQEAQTRAVVVAARLKTDLAMISSLELTAQAALVYFANHSSALLWLEAHDEGVRTLSRQGHFRVINETLFGYSSYELTPEGEEWLRTPLLQPAFAALRENPLVQQAGEALSRQQPDLQQRWVASSSVLHRSRKENLDLLLGRGLRELAVRHGAKSLTIRQFDRWVHLRSEDEVRLLLTKLEAEISGVGPDQPADRVTGDVGH